MNNSNGVFHYELGTLQAQNATHMNSNVYGGQIEDLRNWLENPRILTSSNVKSITWFGMKNIATHGWRLG